MFNTGKIEIKIDLANGFECTEPFVIPQMNINIPKGSIFNNGLYDGKPCLLYKNNEQYLPFPSEISTNPIFLNHFKKWTK